MATSTGGSRSGNSSGPARSVAIKRPNDHLVNNQSGPAAASAPAAQSPSIAVLRDVTVRKHKEEMLLGDQTKYQTIVETMREGYYEIDLDERLVFLNRALANLLGEAEERLLGVDFFKLMSRLVKPGPMMMLRPALP